MIVGLSSTMLASKSLLSAKEEINNDDEVVEIIFPSKPFERIEPSNTDTTKSTEDFIDITSNISLISVVPRDFPTNEPINESVIGAPFYLDLTFSINGEALNNLLGKKFVYDVPNKYINAFSAPESTIIINGEKVGSISEINSGATSVEFKFDSTLPESLQELDGNVQVTLKPIVRLKQELGNTNLDKRTDAVLKIQSNSEVQNLAFTDYPFTILPHTPGAFDWLTNAEDYGLTPPTLYGSSDYYWKTDVGIMANYFYAKINDADIRAKNPNYKGGIPGSGHPYYFFGMSDSPENGGQYYPDLVALCVDIFHSLVEGNGEKADLRDYVGDEAAAEIHYGLHMGAMLAETYGTGIGPGMDVSRGKTTTSSTPIKFTGDTNNQYNQRQYMFGGQLRAWLISARENLNPAFKLNMTYEDLDPQSDRNGSWESVDMDGTIEEIEDMIDDYKNMNYINEAPVGMKVGETKTIFNIPNNQEKFIHYVDYGSSKGLDKVTLIDKNGTIGTSGEFTGYLAVKANTDIKEGDVNIVIRKNTSDLWNGDLGYDSLFDATQQKKAVLSMPKAYQPTKTISVFTEESDYNLEIQKTDQDGKFLTGAEFELRALDGSTSPVKTEEGNGKVKFSPLMPEVTYELTETKAPEGYQKKEGSYTIVMDTDGNLTGKEGTKTLIVGQDYIWDENNLVLSFQVKNTALLGDVELIKFDIEETSKTLSGAKFDLYKEGESTPIKTNLTTDSAGKLTVSGLAIGDYYFVETQAPEGYDLPEGDDNRFEFSITKEDVSKGITVDVTAPNVKKATPVGSVRLYKHDSEDNKTSLEDAEFELYRKDGTLLRSELKMDSKGVISVSDLPIGEYYFLETKAPDGYETPKAPNNRFDFSITQSDTTVEKAVEVNISNIKFKKEIILTKTDADTGEPLPGVTFIIQSNYLGTGWNNQYIVTGEQRKKFITDENGQIIINDQTYPGVIDQLIHDYTETDPNTGYRTLGYRFREIAAPEGYRSPEDPGGLKIEDLDAGKEFSVEIDIEALLSNNSQTLTYSLENYREEPRGSVRLYKYDSQNENIGLEGAEFSLYREDGTLLRTGLKTNGEGILLVSDLSFGKYYFVETKAPDGYFLNDSQYSFEITEEHAEVSLEIQVSNVKAPPRELTLTKIDEETGKPIPGVEFIIQYGQSTSSFRWIALSPENRPLDPPMYFTTDNNGQIIINDNTYPGLIDYMIRTYENPTTGGLRFREIHSPDGYEDPFPTDGYGRDSMENELLSEPYAKDIPMDQLIGSPLSNDPIDLELMMTNKKETSDNSIIRVEKRDKSTGNLITDGEATFIIQSLKADNQWEMFGEERTFTTTNGVAVIEDEELINELLSYQGEPNDQKYRFREIEAPAGYKDPQAPNPLSKKEPQGGIGDEFSKEFVLDKENPETVTVVIENEKPEDPTDRTVSLKKVDEDTGAPLSGAEFIIEKYDTDSKTWKKVNSKTYATNNKGMIELNEDDIQSFGTDYPIYIAFREIKSPDGYELPENTYTETITITADGVSPETVTKENSRIDVDLEFTLRKVDGFSNMPLGGAGFQLYKEDQYGDFKPYSPAYYHTEADGQYIFTD